MKDINIAPHFLVRIAGKDIESITNMKFSDTISNFKNQNNLFIKIKEQSSKLTNELYYFVKNNNEVIDTKKLLNLKRDIFNLRPEKIEKYDLKDVSSEIVQDINKWLELMNRYNLGKKKLKDDFDSELIKKRTLFKKIINDDSFIKAIQLSNVHLYDRLLKYLELDDKELKISKKNRHAELSLVNYLNRMILKPTPFSSFTGLGYGFFEEKEQTSIKLDLNHINSYVNLNLVYLKTIERKLLGIKQVKKNAFISINNTIKKQQEIERINFFVRGKDGTAKAFSNENFISIKDNKIVDHIIKLLKDRKKMKVNKMISSIRENINYKGEILELILYLESIGLVDIHLGLGEQEYDYLNGLVEVLKPIDNKLVQDCLKHLKEISKILSKFSKSNHKERRIYLNEISKQLKKIYMLLELELYHDSKTSLVFEDVYYNGTDLKLNMGEWQENIKDLAMVGKLMPLFDDNILEKISMGIIFEELYSKDDRVDFLEFYQNYKKYENYQDVWRKVKQSEIYREIKILREEFYNYLKEAIKESKETITIDHSWVKKFTHKFPKIIKNINYSIYFQIAHCGNKKLLVINKLGPGHGKHFSRYCNLFEKNSNSDFVNSIKSNYKNISNHDKILVDLNAVMGLNINTHPPLLDNEITYPGCYPNEGINQIYLSDIEIFYDEKTERIQLFSKRYKKIIELVPLGFLFPMLAPPLYKVLSSFTQTNGIEYSFWNKFINENSKEVERLPRLMLGSIVLDRKTWKMPSNIINDQFSEDKTKSFLNIYQLFMSKKIPKHVFLRVANTVDAFSENDILEKDLNSWIDEIKKTRYRKPQFLDSENYFHTEALKKIIQDARGSVTLQEVLPNINDKFYGDVAQNAMEFLIEYY
ncbi:lantibiotic dehydratase [Bacillus sp. FSL R5-0659]|uniref:lantibiotic dehydratase n=1 Tax=Bacillus sp. FSL R5-0659 TaxID=2954590 RepID=UPI0030F8F069